MKNTNDSQILNYLSVEFNLMDSRVKEYQNILNKDFENTLDKDRQILRKIEILEEQRSLIDRIIKVGTCLINKD
jgi:hypothetical protein